jgi:hypothetical protein
VLYSNGGTGRGAGPFSFRAGDPLRSVMRSTILEGFFGRKREVIKPDIRRLLDHFVGAGQQGLDGWRGRALAFAADAAKGTSVILALNRYKCIGCSPGKYPDIRTRATGSHDDSRDSVHDRRLGIAV